MTRHSSFGTATTPSSDRQRGRYSATAAAVVGVGLLAWAGAATRRAADAGSAAEQWAQWRGPTLTGAAAPAANPPTTWAEGQHLYCIAGD